MDRYEELNLKQHISETDPFTVDRYKQFFRHFPPGVSRAVLDIGCNTGRGGTMLMQLDKSLDISGLDVVAERLDRLPGDVYRHKVHGSSTAIPADDCTYDVVVAGEFIEHIYPGDVDKTLTEIFRTLKIRGRLMLTTPNPYDIKRRLRGESILGLAHVSQHYPDMLKLKLKMIGFSNVRLLGSGKMTRYLGSRFPMLSVYGSYLVVCDKF